MDCRYWSFYEVLVFADVGITTISRFILLDPILMFFMTAATMFNFKFNKYRWCIYQQHQQQSFRYSCLWTRRWRQNIIISVVHVYCGSLDDDRFLVSVLLTTEESRGTSNDERCPLLFHSSRYVPVFQTSGRSLSPLAQAHHKLEQFYQTEKAKLVESILILQELNIVLMIGCLYFPRLPVIRRYSKTHCFERQTFSSEQDASFDAHYEWW